MGNCPRRNGKWAVEGTCNQYVECSSGIERLVTCQNHLVFDEQTGDCEHPDVANRLGCTAEELYGFHCPVHLGHARFKSDTDCRAFFTCAVFTNYHPRLGKPSYNPCCISVYIYLARWLSIRIRLQRGEAGL